MKILTATVRDPRRGGEYVEPSLAIEIDEDLHETGDDSFLGDHKEWRLIPHGPFVAVDYWNDTTWVNGNLGEFNTLNLYKDKLVPVTVLTPAEEIDIAMGLDRARRLLRKHKIAWRFVLDDIAGQHGRLSWHLVEQRPTCVRCGRPATGEAYYNKTHLPYCDTHLAEHNRNVRRLRINS